MSQPKDELIKYRLDRAKETIDEAQIMADASHWNACVNLLYDTCFYGNK